MSSGSFVLSKYETDGGDIRPIKVQPETITAWNIAPAGAASGSLVRVSGSRRRIGIKARSVTLRQNVGAAVAGYQPTRPITLPVLTLADFNGLTIGEEVQYQGSAWTVSGKASQAGR